MLKSKTFKSEVTWSKLKNRRLKVGLSGKFKPLVYVCFRDASGERYLYLRAADARELGCYLIVAADAAETIRAETDAAKTVKAVA